MFDLRFAFRRIVRDLRCLYSFKFLLVAVIGIFFADLLYPIKSSWVHSVLLTLSSLILIKCYLMNRKVLVLYIIIFNCFFFYTFVYLSARSGEKDGIKNTPKDFVVITSTEKTKTGFRFDATCTGVDGKVRIYCRNGMEPVIGSMFLYNGLLQKPRGRSNPGGFSYRDYLYLRGITYVAYLKTMPSILGVKSDYNIIFNLTIFKIRSAINWVIAKSINPKMKFFVKGVMLGDKKEMPDDIKQNFSDSGMLHVILI